MARWTSVVLRFRWLVIVAWVGLAVTGGCLAPLTIDRLGYEFGLPGQPAYEANQRITSEFGNGGTIDPLAVVITLPAGRTLDDAEVRRQYADALRRVQQPGWRVISALDIQDQSDRGALVSDDGRTAVALVYPPVVEGPAAYAAALPQLTGSVSGARVAGQPLQITGVEALYEGGGGSDRPIIVEIAFGAGGAMVVLALVFGSLLALLPLLIAAVAITTTFLLVLGLSTATDVSFIVQYLVGLIGLGVAIDYALLVVMRWREERAAGADNTDAVVTAMSTAGRAVVFSGVTVAISLLALVVVPVPFLRSVGAGGLLIPLVSVAVALTLLPVILATAGPKLEWPRTRHRSRNDPGGESRLWRRIGSVVVKHRWIAALSAAAILVAAFLPALGLRLGAPELSAAATGPDPAGQAYRTMVDAGISPGVLRPVEALITEDTQSSEGVSAVSAALTDVDGVAAVLEPGKAAAPGGSEWRRGTTHVLAVLLEDDPATAAGKTTVEQVRAALHGRDGVVVGGSAAENADAVTAIYGEIGWVLLLVVGATFALIASALRSIWLPIKALLLNVLSIGAAYGLTALVWQEGYGAELLFGAESSGSITFWVPLAAFSFLFGLSMDYELFILSRIRESRDSGLSTAEATIKGLGYTGRLVSSAALILFLAFVALSTVPVVDVKIFATTLALGIILDATVVRGVLTPALVAMFGELNWWWPTRRRSYRRRRRAVPD